MELCKWDNVFYNYWGNIIHSKYHNLEQDRFILGNLLGTDSDRNDYCRVSIRDSWKGETSMTISYQTPIPISLSSLNGSITLAKKNPRTFYSFRLLFFNANVNLTVNYYDINGSLVSSVTYNKPESIFNHPYAVGSFADTNPQRYIPIITEEISFIPNTTIWNKIDSFLVTYWELILIGMNKNQLVHS